MTNSIFKKNKKKTKNLPQDPKIPWNKRKDSPVSG